MSRLHDALLNGAVNFVLGFVGGALLGDRRTGVRAGLALGLLGVVGYLVVDALIDRTDAARLAESDDDGAAATGTSEWAGVGTA